MISRRQTLAAFAAVVAATFTAKPVASAYAAGKLTIFAAASLKNALDDISAAWAASGREAASVSYAASSALAKQIEGGAPADIFISADLDWMKYLADRLLIKPESQVELLGNRIVLVAPKDSNVTAKIAPNFNLAGLLGNGRLAIADVKAVPAGKYGKAALETLGVWSTVESKVAQAENARAALKLVATGEAPLGIVYQSDAAADQTVKIVDRFPDDMHPPIVYPVAITAASQNSDAAAFVKYLQSAKARELFEKQGFTVLAPATTN